MLHHVIKYEYRDGLKLPKPELWCGEKNPTSGWFFQDAQHAALSVNGSIQPCKNCIRAIINQLQEGL